MIVKYPPIQGGVSVDAFWTAQVLSTLGHNIQVLTNADEVEPEYKIEMSTEDTALLTGFWEKDSIGIQSTYSDPKHMFIPQNNPCISKLLGMGIEVCRTFKPDLIWAYYFEPYGVAALFLSRITGIPFVFKHAGSDLGRLMESPQLRPIYLKVLEGAKAVLTRPVHYERFVKMGIPPKRLFRSFAVRLPDQVFSHSKPRSDAQQFEIGIYGKTGPAKGTAELIEAAQILKARGVKFRIRAHWGGKNIDHYKRLIAKYDLADCFDVLPLIPHWRIPDFIKSCDLICLLENHFKITFHTSYVPLEALACGRPVLTTPEVYAKRTYQGLLCDNVNAFVVKGSINGASVASRLEEAIVGFDIGRLEEPQFEAAQLFLEAKSRLCETISRLQKVL